MSTKGKSCVALLAALVLSLSGFQAAGAAANVNNSKTENAVMLYVNSPVAYVNNVETAIDKDNHHVVPVVENDRTLVPIRFIAEAFGAKTDWDGAAKTATITKGATMISLTLGESEITVNGQVQTMDAAAKTINGRTFVPLRAVAEALGKQAFYDRGLIILSDTKDIFSPEADKAAINELISAMNGLPVVGTKEKFEELIAENTRGGYLYDGGIALDMAVPEMQASARATGADPTAAAPMAAENAKEADAGGAAYSTTNVQVAGVDEADEIKTDGTHIYYISEGKISVVKAVPAGNMNVDFTLYFGDNTFYPSEMFVDGDSMIVVGSASREYKGGNYSVYKNVTRVIEYDIKDRANVTKIREIDTEGQYISSRKVGRDVYLATQTHAWELYDGSRIIEPMFRDTAVSETGRAIGYADMRYFPGVADRSLLSVVGFTVGQPKNEAHVNTVVGGGSSIYMSKENLYVAAQNYDYETGESGTVVYKFALDKGNVTYQHKANVNGSILNQFSMDEADGFFRIATTDYSGRNGQQSNNLYIFTKTMDPAGKIEDIAPGERIYSVRFMGERAYMVTFQQVDPLFVIDVKDPYNPKILGALKIPGYSDYLHPYDETHLIGFGKDTVVEKGTALYQGMKIAMFDVSDVANPKEMFKEIIGGRGTESPLLQNHKALLFDKARGFMAFPVQVMETDASQSSFEYGAFKFQGAYVYGVDLAKGFTLKGKITHLSDEDILKSGYYGPGYTNAISRIVSIGDTLYTASPGMIKATGLFDMAAKGAIDIEK